MKAAVMEGFREPLVVREVSDPTPEPHGALIRVEANGICRSDWHAWSGRYPDLFSLPHVLGHELSGVIEEVGNEVSRFKREDRVIVPFSAGEGTCEWCRKGHQNICDSAPLPGFTYWGGYARYVAAPYADLNLVPLPDDLNFVEAAGMGCRFMTAFHGLVDQAEVKAGEWVAVHGCGGIGLSAVQIATALGANVIAVDINPAKLELARSLGAASVVNAAESDPVEAVKELTGGGTHVSVDALGIAATCRNAIQGLRKRGRHLQIGFTTEAENGEVSVPIDTIVDYELRIIGSMGMQANRFDTLLGMVAAGKLAPGKLVGRTVPLEEAGAVLQSMEKFETLGVTVIDRY